MTLHVLATAFLVLDQEMAFACQMDFLPMQEALQLEAAVHDAVHESENLGVQ